MKTKRDPADTIHIAMAFDLAYLSPFMVMMTSVLIHNKQHTVHLHVITSGLNTRQQKQLENFIRRSCGEISFYEVSPELLTGLTPPKDTHITVATFFRLFFPQLVPGTIEKLLYLDPDMIILRDLSELYNTSLNGYAVGAVPEINQPWVRSDLGFTSKDQYFNAGVMLIDVKEWIRQEITERSVKYARNNQESIVWADQDALNGVLFGNYFKLDSKYNVLHFDVPQALSRISYEQFIADKVILHFTNIKYKPWSKTTKTPLRFVYLHYLSRSPRWTERYRLEVLYYSVRFRRGLKKQLTNWLPALIPFRYSRNS